MSQNKIILLLSLIGILLLTIVYSNHFNNGFHFDDSHSIESNFYIRDIKNIPLFFKDATTLSSLPQNQSYRPMMPVLYAIDYKLAGGLNPYYFHVSTFVWYILQLILMYFLFLFIFNKAQEHRWNKYFSLCAVAFYGFHTANAETINYISARSDSISTFWFILSLVLFAYLPKIRKWGIYLIPLVIGILVKPVVIVFPAVLFVFIVFFQTGFEFKGLKKLVKDKTIISSIKFLILPFICCAFLYYFQAKMTPPTFIPGGNVYNYLISQPFVFLHYFKTFFFPTELSADTDWTVLESMLDVRFFTGMLFLFLLITIAVFASCKKNLQPIAFGIAWFFITLLPSSSIIPFAEVMNDHRIFFPFVGLTISLFWSIALLLKKYKDKMVSLFSFRMAVMVFFIVILSIHAYGVRTRNKVWLNDENLWYDVTVKSPLNGRGLMNYGLAMMGQGKYQEAEKYYNKALELLPSYSYLHVNMAILKNVQGKTEEAEAFFKKGITFTGNTSAEPFYYYADFLSKHARNNEAKQQLNKALQLVPGHINSRYLLMNICYSENNWETLKEVAEGTLKINPQDQTATYYLQASQSRKSKLDLQLELVTKHPTPEGYLTLSLEYYNAGQFEKCVSAAEEAIKLKPLYPEAYNNICSAFNQLGRWTKAREACSKALEINPQYQLAKNNLNYTMQRQQRIETAEKKLLNEKATAKDLMELSLVYYNDGFFEKCIDICKKVLAKEPNNAEAYNFICSSFNNLKQYKKGIEACNMAIALKPDYQLAKNNLAFAKSKLNK